MGRIFVDIYGGTEMGGVTILHACRHNPDGSPDEVLRLGSVGQAFPNATLRILDDAGAECLVGVAGEICISSTSLMSGYWNNSAATMAAVRHGWSHTGDMGFLDAEGFLFLVDRKKDTIISGGENIYCREVEEAIMALGEILDVAVIGVSDERWGEAVRAVAIRKPGTTVSEHELIEFTRTQIASYKRPKTIVFVQELPKLASGKVSKIALREICGG